MDSNWLLKFFDYFNNSFMVYLDDYFNTIKNFFYKEFSIKISDPGCICGNYKQVLNNCVTLYSFNLCNFALCNKSF